MKPEWISDRQKGLDLTLEFAAVHYRIGGPLCRISASQNKVVPQNVLIWVFLFHCFLFNKWEKQRIFPSLVFFASKTKFHLGIDQFKIHKSQTWTLVTKLCILFIFLALCIPLFCFFPLFYNPFNNIQKSKLISGISVSLVYVLGILVVKILFQIC